MASQLSYSTESAFYKFWKVVRGIFNPVIVFISLQVAWLAITTLWIVWFAEKNEQITELAESFGSQYFDSRYALTMLIIGCILLGMLSFGIFLLFLSGQRQSRLIQQQRSFVSSVTHELRSPLSSLQIAFETLKGRELDDSMRDKMHEMALVDINRLSRLVNQILVSARLDKGLEGFEAERELFNLEEIIRRVINRMYWLDKDILSRISIECPKHIKLESAPAAVTHILANLIENAIKYSPDHSPIKVQATESNKLVTIAIKDEGYGIDKSDKKRIFRIFYRGSVSTKKAISGTGIGLFTVKAMARILGGKVWVESKGHNLGSTFFVNLPKGLTD